jgi:hypothetical protein
MAQTSTNPITQAAEIEARLTEQEIIAAIAKMRSSLDHLERCVEKKSTMSRGVGIALVTEAAEISSRITSWSVLNLVAG